MFQLLIADDEPKIRRGLKKLPWDTIDLSVVGEAEDGIDALEQVKALEPDILLVDINMPKLNGLELIRKLREEDAGIQIIIISGYDEFDYAREAIALGVFDYVLKPVNRKELLKTVKKATEGLDRDRKKERWIHWAKRQVTDDRDHLLSVFFDKWMKGSLNDYEVQQNLMVYGIQIEDVNGYLFIHIRELPGHIQKGIDGELLTFCVLNIGREVTQGEFISHIIHATGPYYLIFFEDYDEERIQSIQEEIAIELETYLDVSVGMESGRICETTESFPEFFDARMRQWQQEKQMNPIIVLAKDYVDHHYQEIDLNLTTLSEHLKVSSSYLSRLLKQDLGMGFSDYLTYVRIQRAMALMQDPTKKIYEVADEVGYATQHYFSAAFKKVTGWSPIYYRKERIFHEK